MRLRQNRLITRQIRVGKLKIGGRADIVIQSMTKTDTRDVDATVKEIRELKKSGCELVRVAVKDFASASAIKNIKRKITLPLVADIHFDYRLAIMAIENGADKVRINPGNIHKEGHILEVANLAKKRHVPIRIGVNSGSLPKGVPASQNTRAKEKDLASLMVRSALAYIKVFEKIRFYDIIVSLKTSDVLTTIDAYRKFSKISKYPLHLGITAAGPFSTGLIKSSIGIGVLLLEGIGDTVRVSLTDRSCNEVIAAKNILQALNIRKFGPEIVSCPTCGRCEVDLQKVVDEVEGRIIKDGPRTTHFVRVRGRRRKRESNFPKIAIMGCEVNGPGEAKEADIGVACGRHSGTIFRKGKVIKRVGEKDIVRELLYEL